MEQPKSSSSSDLPAPSVILPTGLTSSSSVREERRQIVVQHRSEPLASEASRVCSVPGTDDYMKDDLVAVESLMVAVTRIINTRIINSLNRLSSCTRKPSETCRASWPASRV